MANLEDLLQHVRDRTKVTNDDAQLIRELRLACGWVWKRAYLTNAQLEMTFGSSGTFSSDTRTWDVAAEVGATGTLYGIESLWIRANDATDYIQAQFMDLQDPRFLALDQITPVQLLQPVYASAINFDQIRFANTLPADTDWKLDWIAKPANFSLNTNCVTSVPDALDEALIERTCSKVWRTIDDTRAANADADARDLCATGLKVIKRRQWTSKQKTRPFPSRAGAGW